MSEGGTEIRPDCSLAVIIPVDSELYIRPYEESDAPGLYPRLLEHRANGLWWIGSIDGMRSIEDLYAEFRRVRTLLENGHRLGGAVIWNGQIVGTCRITGLSLDSNEGELGYWLFPEARGHGIILRCAKALLDIMFQWPHINRAKIAACPTNSASVSVAERLGFTFERVFPGALVRGGKAWDSAWYIMTKEKWGDLQEG